MIRTGTKRGKILAHYRCSLMGSLSLLLFSSAALAKEEMPIGASLISRSTNNGMVSSDQLLELGTPASGSLRLEGEQCLRFGNLEKAITALEKSVEMSPSDIDGRILYAQALEKKFEGHKDSEPVLYNSLIKQWLFVFKKARCSDQTNLGQRHLIRLTGTSPHRFETASRFLARVTIQEDGSSRMPIERKEKMAAKTASGSFH